ncbi:MAG: alpha/beta hydrolase [Anaerolineae bacterium]|nr:alpha/beta hydrolase [Anaerolineae bacterium]
MSAQPDVKTCDVFGYQLAYHRDGSGETALLVHGITTYSFIWRRIVPLLSAQYDVISVDLLGCGHSDKPLDVDYSIKHHTDLLHEFVAQLDICPFHYVGHDLGAGIGQIYAVRHPEQLFDLTLINTVAYDFWPVQPIITMRTPIIRQLAMATLDFGTLKLLVKRGVYYQDRVTPELMDLFWVSMKTREGRKAFLHFAKCLNNQHLLEIEEALREMSLPVLIIRGEADFYLSSEISQRLHREIPGSKLVRIATGGHYIQEDEPQKITDSIMRFFEENRHARKS